MESGLETGSPKVRAIAYLVMRDLLIQPGDISAVGKTQLKQQGWPIA